MPTYLAPTQVKNGRRVAMILANGLLVENWRAKMSGVFIMRMRVAFSPLMRSTSLRAVNDRPYPNDPVLSPNSEILPILAKLHRPDRILRSRRPRLRCRIRPSSWRTLLTRPRPQLLRQKDTIKLLVLFELCPHFDVRRRMRDLGTEAEIVDVEVSVHTLWSQVVRLGAIVAGAVEGRLLFVAADEAAKERHFPMGKPRRQPTR